MPPLSSKSISQLLQQWNAGDDEGLHAAVPLVYEELRRLAHHYLGGERDGHTLQSTALSGLGKAREHRPNSRFARSPAQNRTSIGFSGFWSRFRLAQRADSFYGAWVFPIRY